MKPSKYKFKHKYNHNHNLIRGKGYSSRVADFRFNIELAKLRFKSIANFFPKNIQQDIESRVIAFYQYHPSSRTSPNSVYACLVYWYNINAKLDLTSQKIADIFDMNYSYLSRNYRNYAWQTRLSKVDNPILDELLEI